MNTLNAGQLCSKLAFIHSDGTRLYPVAIKNRQTGRIAFVTSRPGTNSHHRDVAIEVDDEDTLVRNVAAGRMKVRCQATDGSHKGLFSPDGRNIVRIECSDTLPAEGDAS